MNKENIQKNAIYEYIAKETWLKHSTVKSAFCTKRLNIFNSKDVSHYIFLKKITTQLKWWWIYSLTNIISWKEYIWQTIDFKKRVETHFRELRDNKHCNKELQTDFNLIWRNNFDFIVIRKFISHDKKLFLEEEKKEILSRKDTYNIKSTYNIHKDNNFYKVLCFRHKDIILKLMQDNNILDKDGILINK